MPSVSAPNLFSATFPKELMGPMRDVLSKQNLFNSGVAPALNKSLVLGDTLQVYYPFTQARPLAVPDAWHAPTLAAGVTNFGSGNETAAYMKDGGGIVYVRGTIIKAAVGNIFTLPAAYRPSAGFDLSTWVNTAGTQQASNLGVDASGNVYIQTNAPSTWGSIKMSFPCSGFTPYVPSCFPFDLQWPKQYAPTVVLAQCLDANARSPSNVSMTFPDWILISRGGAQFIRMRNIPGLTPNTSYAVTVVAF